MTVARDCLRISWVGGLQPVELKREEIDEVCVRGTVLGHRLELKPLGRPTAKTVFFPTNPGKVASALEARGWPVRTSLRPPGRRPALYLLLGVTLILVGIAELVVKTGQADALNRRSGRLQAQIESIDSRGGKRYGTIRYEVDSNRYSGEIVLASDRALGNEVVIRYDPDNPSRFWEEGDDPPGTDQWIFGPLRAVPGLFLLFSWRRQHGLRRYFDRRG
ncbi:MAG: hypothetical protein M3314_11880 [Actinomycetota bacterium]|nr:hypothetical protein [Actinomycetota bacterium]